MATSSMANRRCVIEAHSSVPPGCFLNSKIQRSSAKPVRKTSQHYSDRATFEISYRSNQLDDRRPGLSQPTEQVQSGFLLAMLPVKVSSRQLRYVPFSYRNGPSFLRANPAVVHCNSKQSGGPLRNAQVLSRIPYMPSSNQDERKSHRLFRHLHGIIMAHLLKHGYTLQGASTVPEPPELFSHDVIPWRIVWYSTKPNDKNIQSKEDSIISVASLNVDDFNVSPFGRGKTRPSLEDDIRPIIMTST